MTKLLLGFLTAGVMVASAATTYHVSIFQDSTVNGKQIKAGDYKLEIQSNNTAVLKQGKQTIDVPARTETAPNKFSTTMIQFSHDNVLQKIDIGGTRTEIVFGGSQPAPSGTE